MDGKAILHCFCALNEIFLVPLKVPTELSAVGLRSWYQDGQACGIPEGGAGPGYSGHKAVIMKDIDNSTSDHPYSNALVAGIDPCPHKVTAVTVRRKSP